MTSDEVERVHKRASRACGSLKAARCLIDALLAGEDVEIAQTGRSWVVRVPGERRPLVRRMSRENAEAAVQSAREVIALSSSCPEPIPCDRPVTPEMLEQRRQARVVTPQMPRGELARFEVVDVSEIVTSHNAQTFDSDPRYPANVQEREYHRDRGEQMKVSLGAQNLDPSFVLTNTPTPMDGPPLVTGGPVHLALGGNGRSMMLARAYREGAPGERYRAALLERALDFGILPAEVEAIRHPVLVRVVEDLSATSPAADLAAAVRRYNEGLTQQLSPRARAVSEARTMSLETLEALGDVIGSLGDASLRDVMRDRPRELLAILERDGIVNAQNRAQWATAAGLTDEGKDKLEGLFLGRVVGSGDRLNATAPGLLRKLERAVPHLVRVAGLNPELDLIPDVQRALDLLNTAAAATPPLKVDEYLAQGSLFGSGSVDASETVQRLARLFERGGLRQIGAQFKAWSARAAHDPRQPAMFWQAPTRAQALDVLERTPNPATICTRCKGTGRVKAWASEPGRRSFDVCPLCGGKGFLVIDQPPPQDRRQARLFNPGCSCESRRSNPGGELRAVIRPAGKSAGVQLYAVCLAIVEGAKVKQVFSCSHPTPTALETAVNAARKLAAAQGLAIDSGGILLQEAAKDSKARLAAVVVSQAKTTEGLAENIVQQVPAGARSVVAKTPAGLVKMTFTASGEVKDLTVDGRRSKQLEKAMTADIRAAKKKHTIH